MRLTLDSIERSVSFVNALKERELDLRGNKFSVIENLGITRDQHDSIDFTDNAIQVLGNCPYMPRLKNLYINNNRIHKIEPGIGKSLANLECLVLSRNNLEQIEQLTPLGELAASLRILVLTDNPVSRRKQYRSHVIKILPKLQILDFQRITARERQEALDKKDAISETPHQPAQMKEDKIHGKNLSTEQIDRIKSAIMKANSLDEMNMLQRALSMGCMPDGI